MSSTTIEETSIKCGNRKRKNVENPENDIKNNTDDNEIRFEKIKKYNNSSTVNAESRPIDSNETATIASQETVSVSSPIINNINSDTNNEQSIPISSNTIVQQRKRGRPKKSETKQGHGSNSNNNDNHTEIADLNLIQEEPWSSNSNGQPRKRGRPKKVKNSDVAYFDDNKISMCMVCKINVQNSLWFKHKEKLHSYLAWRECEEPLINDEKILKSLSESKNKIGYLKCSKCGKKTKNVVEFKDHLDLCNGIVNSNGSITCAICEMEMEKSSWQYHKYRKHNNLAWRKGDIPLNLDDRQLVLHILNLLYKSRKPLHCEKCDSVKKSVSGYLSHRDTCQKTGDELEDVKVACTVCDKKVLPVSMESHMKIHNRITETHIAKNSNYFDVDVAIEHKRKSAKKAIKLLQEMKMENLEVLPKYYTTECNFHEDFVTSNLEKKLKNQNSLDCLFENCDFSTDSVDSMISHLSACDKKLNQFVICKLCCTLYKEEWEVTAHINQNHNRRFKRELDFDVNDMDDYMSEPDDGEENESKSKKIKKIVCSNQVIKPKFIAESISEDLSTFLYFQAYLWMEIFCKTNYNNLKLHNSIRKSQPWKILHYDLFDKYLPKYEESCDVAGVSIKFPNKSDENWKFKKLKMFECGELYEGDTTIFCGGPISAMAWLPTSHRNANQKQILAVAVLKDGDTKYSTSRTYREPTVIQFWDFGCLNRHLENLPKPSLMVGLAINEGPIWHLEWCPSGCMDESFKDTNESKRLGLLAVATSDSLVHIYDIDRIDESEYGNFYKGDPILKLHFTGGKLQDTFYASRISWSKASGHKYIAVGYTNGMVAIFDVANSSPSLKVQNDSDTTLHMLPYYRFQAHLSCITVLTLHNLSGGNRWLLTASFDKVVVFWDLLNAKKIGVSNKYSSSDGVWMTLWPTCVIAEENGSKLTIAHTCIKTLRDIVNRHLTEAVSGIKCLSFSDWLNTIIHGSYSGEIIARFGHRFMFSINSKYLNRTAHCVFSTSRLFKKTECYQRGTTEYAQSIKKFGLVFEDYKTDAINNFPCTKAKFNMKNFNYSDNNFEEYNLQSINKIMFNENRQACTYYVSGHQAGFIRLHQLKFLDNILSKKLENKIPNKLG